MTHNFHWNVTAPQFNSPHAMFRRASIPSSGNALDQIAERIRALGFGARHLQGIRQARLDQGSGRRAQGNRHDPPSGGRPGSDRPYRLQALLPLVSGIDDQPTADLFATQRLDVLGEKPPGCKRVACWKTDSATQQRLESGVARAGGAAFRISRNNPPPCGSASTLGVPRCRPQP